MSDWYRRYNYKGNWEAVSLTLSQILYLCKKLKPRKAIGNIKFGFDDPATTGNVLAILSVLIGFIPEAIVIEPVFDANIFETDVLFKGKIALINIIIVLFKLFGNKEFRRVFKGFKRMLNK